MNVPTENKITDLEEPAFLPEDFECTGIPLFPTITNAYELYDLRDGENISEAIARRSSESK